MVKMSIKNKVARMVIGIRVATTNPNLKPMKMNITIRTIRILWITLLTKSLTLPSTNAS